MRLFSLIVAVALLQGCAWVDLDRRWEEMKAEVGILTGGNVPVHKFIRGDRPFKVEVVEPLIPEGGEEDEDEDFYF